MTLKYSYRLLRKWCSCFTLILSHNKFFSVRVCVQKQVCWCSLCHSPSVQWCSWSWLLGVWCIASEKDGLSRGTWRSHLFFSFSLLLTPNLVDNLGSCVFYFFRCFRSTSGQSNPVFRSSSTRGSPRVGTTQISQPIFVESSATQACKPLTSVAARPHAGALRPIRTAPEASSCTRVSSYHMMLPFLAYLESNFMPLWS